MASKGIFIIGAKRTPFCSYGGPLRELPACYAFAAAAKDAIQSANVDPVLVDQTVVGNTYYLSQCDGGKTPRYCGIYSGVPIEKPALGVSKSCGTGLQAIITGAVDILFGTSNLILTGGTEIMSSLPMLVRNARFGTSLGASYVFEDHIQRGMVESNTGLSLPMLAEEVAKKYQVTREGVDQFAVGSVEKWKAAQDSKIFADEVTSLTVTLRKKEVEVVMDQLQNVNLDKDQLRLAPTLLEDGTVVTSGNSSVAADGAAALLLASEETVKAQNLKPLARVAGWSCVGVDPLETGVGAAAAIRKLLTDQGIGIEDVDLFEINETFASQVLATTKELNINLSKVNVNGGALALGHPVAATGARMATSLVYEMRRRGAKRAVAASSCGGGQGVAILLQMT